MRRFNPLRSVVEPFALGLALGGVGFLLERPLMAALGALLLIVLSVRIAYDHRGAARYSLRIFGPFWRSFTAPMWWRRQVTGAALFYLAVFLIVGSLRGYSA